MRYWLDTEFIEDGRTIDLISIGIVAEDGRQFYAINSQCDFRRASDWVEENVLNPIGLTRTIGANINGSDPSVSPLSKESRLAMVPKRLIRRYVEEFCDAKTYGVPEFWGDYAAYDWVALCQLFGKMIDLPKSWPMYINDIQQLKQQVLLKNPRFTFDEEDEDCHHALIDARQAKEVWEKLARVASLVDKSAP